jgi:hypothetical protein
MLKTRWENKLREDWWLIELSNTSSIRIFWTN